MLKIKIIVSGRVQGVGFRYSTQTLAKKLGIKGQVWNNDDGTVEILAQAEKSSQLILFIQKLRQGVNKFARVDYLDQTTANFPDFQDFTIKNIN